MSRCVKTGARWVDYQGDMLARPCDLFYHGDGDFELRGIPADEGSLCKGQHMDDPSLKVDGAEFTPRANGEYIDGRVHVSSIEFSAELIEQWRKWDEPMIRELIRLGALAE